MDDSPPANPFSSGTDDDDGDDDNKINNDRFDAFQLSPDYETTNASLSLPSLQSIQAAQKQQQQPLKFDSLPSPDELKGPMTSSLGSGNNNSDPSSSSSSYHQSQINRSVKTDSFNSNSNNNSQSSFLPKFLTCGGVLSIESLRPYFDVDTSDVILRMKSSIKYCVVPDGFRNEVLYSDNAMRLAYRDVTTTTTATGEEEMAAGPGCSSAANNNGGKGPDLYGPIWITMTLVFFLAVTSNMSLYFHHSMSGRASASSKSVVDEGGIAAEEEWDYDINQLLHATWILYSFSFILPIGLYLVFRLLGIISFSVVDLICLYGYSLVAFIPTTWICVAPVSWLQWLSLFLSTVISGMLVLRNVTGPILESSRDVGGGGIGQGGKSGGLIMAVIGCHFIFFLVMKLAFYHHA